MNVFKKSIVKFVLSFIFIIVVDATLLVTVANYIRSQQSASSIIETVSSEIVLTNGNYVVNPTAKQLIDKNNLLIRTVVKKNSILTNPKMYLINLIFQMLFVSLDST